MDDDLAETHASMGAWAQSELNWSEAEKEFRRAIELNPNYATAHLWLAVELARLGRHGEGLAEIRKAQQLDPLSTVINGNIVGFLLAADRYDDAIKEGEKAIRLEPDNIWAHNYLSWTYEKKGMAMKQ
jgi:Flp pilus assembly protein TadD